MRIAVAKRPTTASIQDERHPRRKTSKTKDIQDERHPRHKASKTTHTRATRGHRGWSRSIGRPFQTPWGHGEATWEAVPGRAPNQRLHLTPGSGVPWRGTVSVAPAQVKRGVGRLGRGKKNRRGNSHGQETLRHLRERLSKSARTTRRGTVLRHRVQAPRSMEGFPRRPGQAQRGV